MRKVNKWQRLGIVLSVLSIFGGGLTPTTWHGFRPRGT